MVSYSADDTCHLWKAGIPCLLYGPGVIRGSEDEDDACVLVSEMVKVTRVLAVTALDVCQRRALDIAGPILVGGLLGAAPAAVGGGEPGLGLNRILMFCHL